MVNWIRVILPVVMVCGNSTLLAAEPEVRGEVIEYGFYQAISEVARSKNKTTPTGQVVTAGQVQLVKQATDIPNVQGLMFGFKFRISGYEKNTDHAWLRLVVTHPLIIRPNGSRAEGFSYPLSLAVKNGIIEDKSGYKLDNKYEMIEGDWSFQYWDRERMIVEQKFSIRASTSKDIKLIETVKKDISAKLDKGFYTSKQQQKETPAQQPKQRLLMPGS